ncbi:UNVERIFIED_CONTAM: hypothetical protein GTU68_044724 [Idotea baltica]|nr:hypothetical protein [Idotea baltica]
MSASHFLRTARRLSMPIPASRCMPKPAIFERSATNGSSSWSPSRQASWSYITDRCKGARWTWCSMACTPRLALNL